MIYFYWATGIGGSRSVIDEVTDMPLNKETKRIQTDIRKLSLTTGGSLIPYLGHRFFSFLEGRVFNAGYKVAMM